MEERTSLISLKVLLPASAAISALTGEGLGELRTLIASSLDKPHIISQAVVV